MDLAAHDRCIILFLKIYKELVSYGGRHYKNAQYVHHSISEEMQESCLEEDILGKLLDASAFSLLIDQSTDISTEKHLVLYVMFWNGTMKTHFLSNLPCEDSTAQGIFHTIEI